jgi:plastocyanin
VPKNPVADDSGQSRDLLTVDAKTRGVQFVIAHLEPEKPSDAAQARATGPAASLNAVLVDQRDHTFTPHLVAVRAGQTVVFTNSDPANHNVRATSQQPDNEFNVFTGVGGEHRHRFVADPKGRPVRLDCDIHPWMRGWIYVFDHAAFGITDAQGKFTIRAVPPGRYRLVIRQPDIRYEASETVVVKPGETNRLEFKITGEQSRPYSPNARTKEELRPGASSGTN